MKIAIRPFCSVSIMNQSAVIFCFILSIFVKTGQGLKCFVQGECLNSQFIKGASVADDKGCLAFCQGEVQQQGCEWWTYDANLNYCSTFSNCDQLSVETCETCVSGENECSGLTCFVPGQCQVRLG